MPGAVLRVSGSKIGVTQFLAKSSWKPTAVFWKGEPRFGSSTRVSTINGFNWSVSDADGSRLDLQIRDSKRFLVREKHEIRRLSRLKLHATLDFGVEAPGDVFARFYRFDAGLLSCLAKAKIDLELSHYVAGKGDDV